jgi:7-carboxy-7-deazaguanine synthase
VWGKGGGRGLKIKLAEHFFSVQGEGVSAGVPCLFIRFAGCNLDCGGHTGRLMKDGKATWWCDTETVWMKQHEVELSDVFGSLTEFQYYALLDGRAHVVFTGGEPCLPTNTSYAKLFLEHFADHHSPWRLFTEVETNGTLHSWLIDVADQINCSPKLSNSGMPRAMRIKPDVLLHLYDLWAKDGKKVQFKFVVSNDEDVREMFGTYIDPGYVSVKQVVLMPAVDARKDLAETTKFVWEAAVKHGLRCCTRMHILAYDKVTGV